MVEHDDRLSTGLEHPPDLVDGTLCVDGMM